jgi:hypothetical protein
MADIKKVTYADKEDLVVNSTLPDKNKVNAADMNEIKEAVNQRVVAQIDGVPLEGLDMSTTRDTSTSTEKLRVQLKGSDGKIYYIEVDPDSIYLSNGKKLVTGIGFYLDDDDESITMGNYDEWVSAGCPAFPSE